MGSEINSQKQIKLSPWKLNLYNDCPRCFWFLVTQEISQPKHPMPTVLTGLDTRIKNYFQKYRMKGELPPIIEGKIEGKLVTKPLSFLKFTDEELNLSFAGKLDECIILKDGSYAPLDHKSRGSVTNSIHPAYQLQMDAYGFLLEKNGYPPANKGYLIYYVPLDGELHLGFPFKVDVKEVALDSSRITNLISEAVAISRNPSAPEPSKPCIFCNWRKTAGQSDKY